MSEHPNVQVTREAYAAFSNGDLDKVREAISDDVVWHVANQGDLSGDYKGRDEVFAYFARLIQETGGTLKLDVHDVLANDTHAVVLAHITGERNGKTNSQNVVFVHHVNDAQQTTELWGFPEDQQAARDFWA